MNNRKSPILLIGEPVVDVLLTGNQESKWRFGGITHAVRTFWALDYPYSVAYLAPSYLDYKFEKYLRDFNVIEAFKIGDITDCPNVIVVGDPTEAGPQKYGRVFGDEKRYYFHSSKLQGFVKKTLAKDALIIDGGFSISSLLESLSDSKVNIHIDAGAGIKKSQELLILKRKVETFIVSTSSSFFTKKCDSSFENLKKQIFGHIGRNILFKENRGGSRFLKNAIKSKTISTPAYVRDIVHSVGVGDSFDAAYLVLKNKYPIKIALEYSSRIATEYASTTNAHEFKKKVQKILKLSPRKLNQINGVVLPWEKRPAFNIYIAAPDYPHMDRAPIRDLEACLKYHNFTPRFPIRENGILKKKATILERKTMCQADIELLDDCHMLVAVLLNDDPGTLIEIGMAIEKKIPVVVYDPYSIAKNLMLTELPKLISRRLDSVIAAVFLSLNSNEKSLTSKLGY